MKSTFISFDSSEAIPEQYQGGMMWFVPPAGDARRMSLSRAMSRMPDEVVLEEQDAATMALVRTLAEGWGVRLITVLAS